jgi:hydroxyacyl-ACP dehydratase HTD2-like protein with hotdog domain
MLALGDGNSHVSAEDTLQEREDQIFTADGYGVIQNGVVQGSSLVPTEHLAFFTPRVSSSSLGADGSDTSFNPPGGVFTRRMWAGGQMSWPAGNAAKQARVGDRMWERTFVEDAQLKRLAGGRGEMIVVWVRKEFGVDGGSEASIVDRRSWVFQKALPPKAPSSPPPSSSDSSSPHPPAKLINATRIVQSPSNLFRYSALTFNAHAIHLSTAWAREVEGHRDIVVHGPLNLSLLVRKWGREVAGWYFDQSGCLQTSKGLSRPPPSLLNVSYRAKRPVYAGQTYFIGLIDDQQNGSNNDGQHQHRVVAMHADGQVAMEATITSSTQD